MNLTIFGATGATGTRLVEQALAAGHEVTAVVRDPSRLAVPPQQRLHVLTADAMDPAAILPAVAHADAVLSALGPRRNAPTTITQDSVSSIIQAMRKTGVRRLLTVSGSIVTDVGEGIFMRYLVKSFARRTFLRYVSADMRRAENEIHQSDLDWTIIRAPSLTSGPAAGKFRTAIDRNLPRGFTISRADLAAYMLTLIDDPATVRRHIAIAK
jgi:putative NADH-flavin reductase